MSIHLALTRPRNILSMCNCKVAITLLCTLLSIVPAISFAEDINYNQIELNARAQQHVDNDIMIVSLYAQEQGSVAADAARDVNAKINAALGYLKGYPAIKVETDNYSTTPVYNKSQLIGWRVKQSIVLESKQLTVMSDVIGELQKSLKLSGIEFDVSREKRELVTKSLIDKALSAYQERADQVVKKLGGNGYKIVKINISTSGAESQPRRNIGRVMYAESSMAASTPPHMDSGDSLLSVMVHGTIELD